MRMKHILFVMLLLSLLLESKANKVYFNNLSVEDGLSQVNIYSIYQDETGALWFGSLEGINRYNGHSFTNFHPSLDNSGLTQNEIMAICGDKKGYVYIQALHDLIQYDIKKQTFSRLMTNNVYNIEYHKDTLWVVTEESLQYRTHADSVLVANRRSWRDESIQIFLKEVNKDIENGYRIVLGGDFNEPSHLDWQANTKDMWDHNGLIVNWDCSTLLYGAGFKDAYRMVYSNVVTHPGFTFPSDNAHAPVNKLAWAPDADERDRIDFIYYYPIRGFKPSKAFVVGPTSSIVRAKRVEENSSDSFITPLSVWPSDHKAVLVEFKF